MPAASAREKVASATRLLRLYPRQLHADLIGARHHSGEFILAFPIGDGTPRPVS